MTGTDRLARLRGIEGGHFWSVGRDALTDALIQRFHMAAPFLDAGSGTGAYGQSLAGRGLVATVDLGQTFPGGVAGNVEQLPFRTGAFGTVLVRDVLEHVDDRAALTEAKRVLGSGGHLLATVPGWPSLWGPRDEMAGHLRRYRRRQLQEVVEEAGFDILEMRGYQFALLPLVIAARVIGKVGGRTAIRREERVRGVLNRVLTNVNLAEVALARRARPRPPTGSSLVLVARRP